MLGSGARTNRHPGGGWMWLALATLAVIRPVLLMLGLA
jgi:hypothetical protein